MDAATKQMEADAEFTRILYNSTHESLKAFNTTLFNTNMALCNYFSYIIHCVAWSTCSSNYSTATKQQQGAQKYEKGAEKNRLVIAVVYHGCQVAVFLESAE